MQWLRYMIWLMVSGYLVWSAWSLRAGRYEESVGMFASALLTGALYHFFFRRHLIQDALRERLEKEGLRVPATILSVQQTSRYLNETPVMRVKVKYTAGGREHTHEIKQPVSYLAVSHLQPHKRITVLVDPKNTDRFLPQP